MYLLRGLSSRYSLVPDSQLSRELRSHFSVQLLQQRGHRRDSDIVTDRIGRLNRGHNPGMLRFEIIKCVPEAAGGFWCGGDLAFDGQQPSSLVENKIALSSGAGTIEKGVPVSANPP